MKFNAVLCLIIGMSLGISIHSFAANSVDSKTAEPISYAQVIQPGEIHLALPSWEAAIIGYNFNHKPKVEGLKNSVNYLSGVALGATSSYYFLKDSFAHQNMFRKVAWHIFAGYASSRLHDGIVFFADASIDYYYGTSNLQIATRLALDHAERLCNLKGFRTFSELSGYYIRKMQFIKPLYLEAEDFDRFKVYLDGELITSEMAMAFTKNSKSWDHYQFNTLFCE